MAEKSRKEDLGNRFPKQVRLRKSAEFERVYNGKVYSADDVLVMQCLPNGLDHCRLGLSVSRKVGNAVVRNRWKRLIREAFRLNQSELQMSLDLVIRPRKGAEANFYAIEQSLIRLYEKVCRRLEKSHS